MNRGKDLNMKEAIEQMLKVYRLDRKFEETSLISAWPELIGPAIANRTTQIYIRDKKLYVKVESAVIKHELMLMRTQILGRMNEYIGKVVVEELILL